jgi:hypothetical protein
MSSGFAKCVLCRQECPYISCENLLCEDCVKKYPDLSAHLSAFIHSEILLKDLEANCIDLRFFHDYYKTRHDGLNGAIVKQSIRTNCNTNFITNCLERMAELNKVLEFLNKQRGKIKYE